MKIKLFVVSLFILYANPSEVTLISMFATMYRGYLVYTSTDTKCLTLSTFIRVVMNNITLVLHALLSSFYLYFFIKNCKILRVPKKY